MSRQFSLAGQWRRIVGGSTIDWVDVPGSYPPVGECTLETKFPRPFEPDGSRTFLVTEGVLARARFTLNDIVLGEAGPYSRCRFEIDPTILRDENVLTARVIDCTSDFGTTPGRLFEGGLIRPVYLEQRSETLIHDVVFSYELDADYASADCTVATEIDGPSVGAVTVTLTDIATNCIVARAEAGFDGPARFTVADPRLWSPGRPDLYRLDVALSEYRSETFSELVGFRHLEIRDRDFYLNGKRLVLKGVNRHEFTSASGYSPSEKEVRRELALIRHSGFNYIRLVHSPQSAIVCRIAAEIGILVSEEPGACFHNLKDPKVIAPAILCLADVIKRDRNVPSVFAWLIYNECPPDTHYAVAAADVCRKLDPGRFVSMADCSFRFQEVREMAAAANLSYYGQNIYTVWEGDIVKMTREYTDKPLVISEWGGAMTRGNERILGRTCGALSRMAQASSPDRIAGFAYWAWADYEEYSRADGAAVDGWTTEGLIDQTGNPRPDLQTLSHLCFDIDHPRAPKRPAVDVLINTGARPGQWHEVAFDTVTGDQFGAETALRSRRERYEGLEPEVGQVVVDGVPFRGVSAQGREYPLLLGGGRDELFIPVGRTVDRIAILGHVDLDHGYPASEIWSWQHPDSEPRIAVGDPASVYELIFEDGSAEIPLRHGIEVLRGNDICRWWKTAPRCALTVPALRSVIHPEFEILRVDFWERSLDKPSHLVGLRWRLTDSRSIQAIYAMSVRLAG